MTFEMAGYYRVQLSNRETFEVTAAHPFWVAGKGWIAVRDLVADDMVYSASGDTHRVAAIEFVDVPVTVYNITVDGLHNYFVGESAILVHNKAAMNGFSKGGRGNLKRLTDDEIKKLQKAGYDVEDLKTGGKSAGGYELYKGGSGNIIVKPKGGKGEGTELYMNIRELDE